MMPWGFREGRTVTSFLLKAPSGRIGASHPGESRLDRSSDFRDAGVGWEGLPVALHCSLFFMRTYQCRA